MRRTTCSPGNQVFKTVISGVLVFVIGQIIQKFIIEPLWEYKKTLGKIDYRLKYYSNKMSGLLPEEIITETSNTIRELSCELEASYKQIPFNCIFAFLSVIPWKKDLSKAAVKLILVSNITGLKEERVKIYDEIKEIRELLKIQTL